MIPSSSTQVDPCIGRILKNRTMSRIPSIRNSDASTRVSDATPSTGCMIRYAPKHRYATPTRSFHIMLPAPCAPKASIRWTTPAKTISQATTALTATAARKGEPTAITPKTISKTPHKMEIVEAFRTNPTEVFCPIEASSKNGLSLPQKGNYLKMRTEFTVRSGCSERRSMVRPERFELPTYCSGGNRSIHLSYGRAVYQFTWQGCAASMELARFD